MTMQFSAVQQCSSYDVLQPLQKSNNCRTVQHDVKYNSSIISSMQGYHQLRLHLAALRMQETLSSAPVIVLCQTNGGNAIKS